MTLNHNFLAGKQGGQSTREHNDDILNEYFHLTDAQMTAVETLGTGMFVGTFSVTLGVESVVEIAGLTANHKVFLMPNDVGAAALATAVGYRAMCDAGSFTAIHGSAISTASQFNYLAVPTI